MIFFSSSVVGNTERTNLSTSAPKVSIHVNHSSNGAITTHISSQNSGSVKIRPKSSNNFPALSSEPVPEVQWVKPSTSREPKLKVSKIAPAPKLPSRNSPVDFPSLSEPKTKKSSVLLPVNNTWGSESTSKDTKSKNSSNSAPSNSINKSGPHNSKDTTTKNISTISESKDNSNKNKNKKKKMNKSTNNNNSSEYDSSDNKNTQNSQKLVNPQEKQPPKKDIKPQAQQNGIIKKRSELKIDSLKISDTNINGNGFPTLGNRKLPPGINTQPPPGIITQPPPGFAANDLTFTNSSGQSYSILPTNQFIAPPNFSQRNKILVERFLSALKSSDKIFEFKQISNMFRNGNFPSEHYYEHCKNEIGSEFSQIFPELLVLLPDIRKQQELFDHHVKKGGSKKSLEVCATCNQVVASSDLRNHLANHMLENHFPALGTQEISSVWRK